MKLQIGRVTDRPAAGWALASALTIGLMLGTGCGSDGQTITRDDAPDAEASGDRWPSESEPVEREIRARMIYEDTGFPLKMVSSWRDSECVQWSSRRPAGISNPPPGGEGKRYWGRLVLGDQSDPNELGFVIDDDGPEGLTRFYQPSPGADFIKAENTGTTGMGNLLDFDLEYPGEKECRKMPYRLWFFIHWREERACYYAQCHRRGTLKLQGERYRAVLFDNPANGDYSDDPVAIDLNDDGRADERELFRPGSVIRLGEYEWRLQPVDAAGTEVRLIRK